MSPFIVLSQAAAVPAVGWIRDRTGTYLPAIFAIVALTLVAALCISNLRPQSASGGDPSAQSATRRPSPQRRTVG
jgi:hypothetical protein